jgi:hypothetical protein
MYNSVYGTYLGKNGWKRSVERVAIDGSIIFKLIINSVCEEMDRIHVAQERLQWRDLVNTV